MWKFVILPFFQHFTTNIITPMIKMATTAPMIMPLTVPRSSETKRNKVFFYQNWDVCFLTLIVVQRVMTFDLTLADPYRDVCNYGPVFIAEFAGVNSLLL